MENIVRSVAGFILLALALFFGISTIGSLSASQGVWNCAVSSGYWLEVCNSIATQGTGLIAVLGLILIIIAAVVIIQSLNLFKEVVKR